MEISRMTQMGGMTPMTPVAPISSPSADISFELPTRKAAPAKSAAQMELGGHRASALDVVKLENAIAEQDGDTTTEEFLSKLIEKVNDRLSVGNRSFDYSRHKKTGQLMIKIIDSTTKEVVREIPPEKTLDAVARMWDMMGIFVDNKT